MNAVVNRVFLFIFVSDNKSIAMSFARIISFLIVSLGVFNSSVSRAQTPENGNTADTKLLDLLNGAVTAPANDDEPEELSRKNNPFFDFIGDDVEAIDSIADSLSVAFIKPRTLPKVAFMPMVFDRVVYLDSVDVTDGDDIFAGEIAGTDWLKEVAESNRRYRYLKQTYMMAYPERVRYNINTLPVPPKTYKATVDPSTSRITLDEVIVNVSESDLKSEVAPVEVIQKHWLHVFNASAQFSQAYVSPNWYQGGDNNINAIANIKWNVKLNPKFHPNFIAEATTQYKLGIASAPNDSIHNYAISQDMFQFNGTLGLRAVNNWYYSMNATFKTQFFNNYKPNSHTMKAAFMSPGELNVGLGMTYNYKNKPRHFAMDMSIAPLSYNLKVSSSHRIPVTNFGIGEGHRTASEVGSNAEIKVNWDIMWNINYTSRLFVFTDYDYLQGDWENTLNFSINRYLSTQIFVHLRYDSSTPKDSRGTWRCWQLKEILSFGLQYQFKTI